MHLRWRADDDLAVEALLRADHGGCQHRVTIRGRRVHDVDVRKRQQGGFGLGEHQRDGRLVFGPARRLFAATAETQGRPGDAERTDMRRRHGNRRRNFLQANQRGSLGDFRGEIRGRKSAQDFGRTAARPHRHVHLGLTARAEAAIRHHHFKAVGPHARAGGFDAIARGHESAAGRGAGQPGLGHRIELADYPLDPGRGRSGDGAHQVGDLAFVLEVAAQRERRGRGLGELAEDREVLTPARDAHQLARRAALRGTGKRRDIGAQRVAVLGRTRELQPDAGRLCERSRHRVRSGRRSRGPRGRFPRSRRPSRCWPRCIPGRCTCTASRA